jgi:hypothetical protein
MTPCDLLATPIKLLRNRLVGPESEFCAHTAVETALLASLLTRDRATRPGAPVRVRV